MDVWQLKKEILENEYILDLIESDILLKHADEDSIIEKAEEVSGSRYYDDIMYMIEKTLRMIKPKGYIDKEEAKKLICEYLDTFYVKNFE